MKGIGGIRRALWRSIHVHQIPCNVRFCEGGGHVLRDMAGIGIVELWDAVSRIPMPYPTEGIDEPNEMVED